MEIETAKEVNKLVEELWSLDKIMEAIKIRGTRIIIDQWGKVRSDYSVEQIIISDIFQLVTDKINQKREEISDKIKNLK